MGAWADAATARNELRAFLSDGPQDRPVKNKQIVGVVDGVNTSFVTFDDRLVAASLIVTVDLAPVAATLNDPVLGSITTTTPPPPQSTVRATYYFQYFIDSELDEALRNASGEIQESDDVTLTPFGLKNAVMNFAGYFCFTKQSIRWVQRVSEKFILEEVPVDSQPATRSNLFKQLADSYLKAGIAFRQSFYERHGRRAAPAFTVFKPNIPPVGPRR